MDVDQVVAGRYRLTERVGGGGMGVVWQAHDERLRRTVAVKEVIMPPGLDESRLAEIRRRTMREGRIAAKLHHPQLITVYDVVEDGGRPYLIMEYLPSTSLSAMLADGDTLPPTEVARIGAQAAAALAAAHAAGVVHRDVKPANILVGAEDTVKITDFGISRVVEDVTGTVTGTFVGTPAYLAPEVAQGREVTFPSDVYSLGATLYTAVEGTPPAGRSDNPMLLLHRIASGEVVAPKQAGPLTDVLLKLLSSDPTQRPTMHDARAALARIAAGEPAPAKPAAPAAAPAAAPVSQPASPPAAQPTDQTERPAKRRAVVALAALVVVLAVATTLVLVYNNRDESGDATSGPPVETQSSQESETAETTEETSEETSDTPTSTPSSQAPSSTVPPPAPGDPAAAVTGYYALMPGDPDAGWTRLTPKFQQNPAGGPEGYRRFWNEISAVRVSEVAPRSGGVVEVTVAYSFKSGRQTRERHRYQLVDQNGRWLIDTVDVLSSTG